MAVIKVSGGVGLVSDGERMGGRDFFSAEGWPKKESGAINLGATTTVQALVIAAATPVKVLALECQKPVFLKCGGGALTTTRVGVSNFILVHCDAKTITVKNTTVVDAEGNMVRYTVCGG